jgi:predicted nucleic acid-binding protein
MLIDTDVLIWLYRGDARAKAELDAVRPEERFVSVVSYMELVQGVRNKAELKTVKDSFETSAFTLIQLSQDTGIIACRILERFALQSGLKTGDALIAATAFIHTETIFTGNYRHFKDLGVSVKQFIPDN